MLKVSRIVLKILLCISVIVTLDMLSRFLNNFVVTSEGVNFWLSPLTLLLYDDTSYSSGELFYQFYTPALWSLGFFIINTILDIIAIIKSRKDNPNFEKNG